MSKKYMLLTVCSVLFVIGLCVSSKIKLLIVRSESLPYRAMLLVKGSPYKKGDYVTVEHHHYLYLADDMRLTKKVIGMSGDRITFLNNQLYIAGNLIGDLHNVTHNNQKLTPLQSSYIPEGYVFIQGEHPDSYDSRYQEFGLVKTDHIVGRSWPLF